MGFNVPHYHLCSRALLITHNSLESYCWSRLTFLLLLLLLLIHCLQLLIHSTAARSKTSRNTWLLDLDEMNP